MEIIELLLALLFVCGIFFLVLTLFFMLVIRPIINRKVIKKSNKLQWKCVKDIDSIHCNKYFLCYRTLPSELNKCANTFGDNSWIHVKKFDFIEFENKQQFIDFVKQYETREQIEHVIEEENGWIYP